MAVLGDDFIEPLGRWRVGTHIANWKTTILDIGKSTIDGPFQ